MRSEALKNAQDKYYKDKIAQIKLTFNRERDADILDRLKEADNVTDYIRELVRADIECNNA